MLCDVSGQQKRMMMEHGGADDVDAYGGDNDDDGTALTRMMQGETMQLQCNAMKWCYYSLALSSGRAEDN